MVGLGPRQAALPAGSCPAAKANPTKRPAARWFASETLASTPVASSSAAWSGVSERDYTVRRSGREGYGEIEKYLAISIPRYVVFSENAMRNIHANHAVRECPARTGRVHMDDALGTSDTMLG
jgi:hypothetical protein